MQCNQCNAVYVCIYAQAYLIQHTIYEYTYVYIYAHVFGLITPLAPLARAKIPQRICSNTAMTASPWPLSTILLSCLALPTSDEVLIAGLGLVTSLFWMQTYKYIYIYIRMCICICICSWIPNEWHANKRST